MSYCLYGCRIRAYTGVVYGRIWGSYMGVYGTRINRVILFPDDRFHQNLLLANKVGGCGAHLLVIVCYCLHTA